MTVTFRIERLQLDTAAGEVDYDFPADLTVLTGPTGAGKTSLLELIKFGIGGDAQLADVVEDNVTDVHLSLRIGDQHLQLSRAVDVERRRNVRVLDLITRERMPDHSVGGESPTVSDLLMNALGLDTGLRAAARGGRSTNAGAQITFNDIFRYMYVPQAAMNREIAGSAQSYYTPKRKTVFEILFGLTSASLLDKRSQINRLKNELEVATRDAATVSQFLADSGLTSRTDAQIKFDDARRHELSAEQSLAQLQNQLADVIDRESQVMRDLLNDAERSRAEAQQLATELKRQQEDYETERKRVSLDIDRLARMDSAGERLANIEFAVCPRCTQSLTQRDVPDGVCRVCLQPDIVVGLPPRASYEAQQLHEQRQEISEQLKVIKEQAEQVSAIITDRTALVASLTGEIDKRTATRVTPRLQAYADAAATQARSRATQESLEQVLRQWDRAEDLALAVEALGAQRAQLVLEVQTLERELSARKDEIFAELNDEFRSTVSDFGIPSVTTAEIDLDTYLPLLNGRPFDRASLGGGIITATQVAYWISLVTVAARRRDTYYPAFLLLDSPRLALNTAEDIAVHMYRRFATQVGATPGRLQFIIGDNELPPEYERDFMEVEFSYDSPTVSTVVHPGPAQVQTLDSARSSDELTSAGS